MGFKKNNKIPQIKKIKYKPKYHGINGNCDVLYQMYQIIANRINKADKLNIKKFT